LENLRIPELSIRKVRSFKVKQISSSASDTQVSNLNDFGNSAKQFPINRNGGIGRPWITTGSIYEMGKINENTVTARKVQFCQSVSVVLIPTSQEYIDQKLDEVLWYNDNDFKDFKLSAIEEIKKKQRSHSFYIDAKAAAKMLYNIDDKEELCIQNL
jgi:hypothetical protein